MSSTEKIINLDLLTYYDSKIKEYISNNTGTGNGVAIYDDYSKLPNDLTEDTIAYCKNDYVDNTDVDNPITYFKGFCLYDTTNNKWTLVKGCLFETEDITEAELDALF